MAYDPERQQIVAFGGGSFEPPPTAFDIWIYRAGQGWTNMPNPNAAVPRLFGQAMTFDPVRRRVVMAGGRIPQQEERLANVWSFDGTTWQPEPSLPEPRASGTLVYDRARNRLVYHGGELGDTSVNVRGTVFELPDGAARWLRAPVSGRIASPVVEGQVATFFPSIGEMITTAGLPATLDSTETLRWNGARWARIDAPVTPGPRCFHSAARARDRSSTWLSGGCRLTNCEIAASSTWLWTDREWRRLGSNVSPPAVSNGLMVSGFRPGSALLLGGRIRALEFNRDGFEVDETGWRRTSSGRVFEAAGGVLFEALDRVVFFGGNDPAQVFDDLYTWDAEQAPMPLPAMGTGPQARSSFMTVYESARASMLVHGGITQQGETRPTLGDTWRLERDGDGVRWTQISDGFLRAGAAMVYDPVRDRTLVIGGGDDRVFSADAFELVDDVWRPLLLDGAVPSARLGAAAFYDPELSSVVLYGGSSSAVPRQVLPCAGDTWILPVPAEARPALSATFQFGVAEVDRRDVSGLRLTGVVGGRGYALTVPGTGAAQSGVRVEGWSHLASAWVSVAELDADLDAPDDLDVFVSGVQARDLVAGDGRVHLRLVPRSGVGSGASAPAVAAADLEIIVEYDDRASDNATCGNGRLEAFAAEVCDDGNTVPGDGCSPSCFFEDGFVCTRADPSVCRPLP